MEIISSKIKRRERKPESSTSAQHGTRFLARSLGQEQEINPPILKRKVDNDLCSYVM
jgi:hypothetical protein